MNRGQRKTRLLCLLALSQLVAGPLVLMLVQATALCRLTVREIPVHGAEAVFKAWQSVEFQTSLAQAASVVSGGTKPPLPGRDSRHELGKTKITATPWRVPDVPAPQARGREHWTTRPYAWTPTWPHAPPGLPPRIA